MMNPEMAWQTSQDDGSSKAATERSARIAGSYVRNVTVKFEEQMSEPGSPQGLIQAQRSHNMHISFSLHSPSLNDNLQSAPVSRNMDSSTPRCPGNVIDLADSRKVRGCLRSVVTPAANVCGRSSDPFTAWPKSSDSKSQGSLCVPSVDVLKSQSASDLRLAAVEPSNARCDVGPRVKCCVATLNLALSRGVHAGSESATAGVTSFRCG